DADAGWREKGPDRGQWHGPVRDSRLRRPARGHRAPTACSGGRRSRRDDVMETTMSSPPDPHAPVRDTPAFDPAPPGERYYRHPGDVVRLVLWGTAALLLAIVIQVGTHTTDGVAADLGRVTGRA